MPTTVVGFRLGNDESCRQVTVLVTESGVLHRSHGGYGRLPRMSRPVPSPRPAHPGSAGPRGESPLARPVATLRELHCSYTKKGYSRALVPPACVRLELEEYPLPAQEPSSGASRPHRELTKAFVGAAPATPQPLDLAIHEFLTALGPPSLPRDIAGRPRPTPVPPRIEAMLHTLAHGSQIDSPTSLTMGWRVTPQAVSLRVGRTGQVLDRQAVAELQAALTAWLRFTQR